MEKLFQDIRYSLRMLLKSPAFTAVAVLSIALGIGANTAVFSVVNAVLLKSLPFKEPDRIALLWGKTTTEGVLDDRNQVSATDVADFRSQNSVFEEVAAYTNWMPILSGDGQAERLPSLQVGEGFFQVMKAEPTLGRVFSPEEQQEGKDFVVVLSFGLWQRRFASDPGIIGKIVQLNSRPYTIIGVMPADFHSLPATLTTLNAPQVELYRPVAEPYDETQRGARHLRAIARLKPGVTLQQAQSEMKVIAERLEQEHPTSNTGQSVRLVSITEDLVGTIRPTLLLIFGAVVFVLLIACANVGNLLLARSSARQKEITIRAALGASRARLVRQLLTESLMLSFLGGGLGLLLALWGTGVIEALGSQVNPLFSSIEINLRVLAFTFAMSILTGVIFGLVPALQLSKTDLNESLKEGGRSSGAGATRNRLRSALVVSEVALTLILLVCAGLLIQTVMRLREVNTGFTAKNILTMNIGLPGIRYPKPSDRIAFFNTIAERLEALPGVEAAGVTSVLPLSGNFDGRGLVIEDHPKPRGEEVSVDLYVVTPGYQRAMQIQLLKGRLLLTEDVESSQQVALVNETMARTFWADENPIGKRIKMIGSPANPQPWREIVGVVGDVTQYGIDKKPPMQFYLPESQMGFSFMSLVVRTTSEPVAMTAAVRNEILAVDKEQAVYNIATMEDLLSSSISLRRFFMLLLLGFAGLALALAAVGIYGVMSYAVSQRTREIGIRLALGAEARDIFKLVIGQGMLMALLGVAIGVIAALAVTQLMSSQLFGVGANDPITFTVIALLLSLIALLACYIPARRAVKVDPMVALRYE
jgi:putative ABC transport system permease protein